MCLCEQAGGGASRGLVGPAGPCRCGAHLSSCLLAPGLLPRQVQLLRGARELLPQPVHLRVLQRQGLGDQGGVLVRGPGARSKGRLGRTLDSPALPGSMSPLRKEAAPHRPLCPEGVGAAPSPPGQGPASQLGLGGPPTRASFPLPPAPAQHLLFPSVGQGASRTTSSPEQPTRSRRCFLSTGQAPLMVLNLPKCFMSLRVRRRA